MPITQESFQEKLLTRCPIYDKKNVERSLKGKRLRGVLGFLRPDALLYNENDAADPENVSTFWEDLPQRMDVVITVETTLRIPLLETIMTTLCWRIDETAARKAWLYG